MAQKILMVDPDTCFVAAWKLYIEDVGYEVITAPSGEEAMAKIISEQPRLLILSTPLPDMDAFDIVRYVRLRLGQGERMTPIIMLAEKGNDESLRAWSVKANHYLWRTATVEYVLYFINMCITCDDAWWENRHRKL